MDADQHNPELEKHPKVKVEKDQQPDMVVKRNC